MITAKLRSRDVQQLVCHGYMLLARIPHVGRGRVTVKVAPTIRPVVV
jgi:hypothetical protein